jgi:hypothetical protein
VTSGDHGLQAYSSRARRHLLSLINDILDLSRIEAGRMELEVTEFDLPTAIENALILVRERASRHGIRLGSTIDERLGMIGGDERKVKQVLLNLLLTGRESRGLGGASRTPLHGVVRAAPPTPDRHAARSHGHPEDPRAPSPLPLRAESRPRPTRVWRRRILIGSSRARRAPSC